ncbi:MAG: hypothetical protein A2Z26_07295 [Deltaproteobacteria bacterium RBG_16_66_15]|nr:MAG: hypothetical protein A2Z26_07295 [Deltaproteobacteria bacterium RBG_16_66_15]
MPSIVDCPVPYRLSKKCFVFASFTAMIGYRRTPFSPIAINRMTPVVVSSVPPTISFRYSFFFVWTIETRSAPSSMVTFGATARAERICR